MRDTDTLAKIAKKLDCSRERVRQIELSALRKLRHPRNNKAWKDIYETVAMIEDLKRTKWCLKGTGGI